MKITTLTANQALNPAYRKARIPRADTLILERQIDVLVYKLYGLTYAEVLVVEPRFGLGE